MSERTYDIIQLMLISATCAVVLWMDCDMILWLYRGK